MYQVLARKYRPRNFAELVGQEHVSKALTNALARGRLHHAYLFTGTRGVGKTTIARILSKCLNCETGITPTPCDVCDTCVAINQGRFIDLIEIDAASRTKVEDTRDLLDNVPYAPTQGRYKVYLIDEVHMLSTHSFNALLKTLEEPPEHVKFLLATTDPQKLPITVVSRCLQFTLRPLPQQDIHDHLQAVLNKEHIGFDDRALWQLAEAAQGSLRDALSLTDQAIAFGQGQVQGQDVQDMLGLLDKAQVLHLLQAINQGNTAQVTQLLQRLANQAVDLRAVLDQLVTLLHQIALVQLLPEVVVQGTQEFQQHVQQLATMLTAEDIQLYYQIALQGRQDLKHAVTLQQGFDMCILRMLAFKPLALQQQVLGQPEQAPVASSVISPVASTQIEAPVVDMQPIETPLVSAPQPMPQAAIQPSMPVAIEPAPEADHIDVDDEPDLSDAPPVADMQEAALFADEPLLEPTGQDDMSSEMEVPPVELVQPLQQEPEPVVTPAQPEQSQPAVSVQVDTEVEEPVTSPDAELMPQQILRHKQVEVTGSWDLEKWECWLREAPLNMAQRNLAQHGLMLGDVGGQSTFVIEESHHLMAKEFIDGLVDVLKQQWPDCKVELSFQTMSEPTPLHLKDIRAAQALQQAESLLKKEPVVASLMQQFSATLSDVQLKD